MPATVVLNPASSPAPAAPRRHDVGGHVHLRVRHPPRSAIDLTEPHRQHRGAGQAPADGSTQRPGINRTVQQDDLAGVPGHGLVLQREDAQILGGQAPPGSACPAPRQARSLAIGNITGRAFPFSGCPVSKRRAEPPPHRPHGQKTSPAPRPAPPPPGTPRNQATIRAVACQRDRTRGACPGPSRARPGPCRRPTGLLTAPMAS